VNAVYRFVRKAPWSSGLEGLSVKRTSTAHLLTVERPSAASGIKSSFSVEMEPL
jgi:hypothetical protein